MTIKQKSLRERDREKERGKKRYLERVIEEQEAEEEIKEFERDEPINEINLDNSKWRTINR